jgi:hypothetical protein
MKKSKVKMIAESGFEFGYDYIMLIYRQYVRLYPEPIKLNKVLSTEVE